MQEGILGLFSFTARPLSLLIVAFLNIQSLFAISRCDLQRGRGMGAGNSNCTLLRINIYVSVLNKSHLQASKHAQYSN
jgi:hypothetical protein